MAEAEKQGIAAKIQDSIKSLFSKDGKASEAVDHLREQASETAHRVSDAVKGEDGERLNKVNEQVAESAKDVGAKLKGLKSSLGGAKEAFGGMNRGTQAAALGGTVTAAEGAVSTVRNVKNKQFGRAAFAAARTAIGAVATVAAFQAQSNGQGLGEFAQGVLNSRKGGAAKSGPQV